MARVPAATVVRLLAGLLTFAILLTASPLPLLQAAVAAPVEEEADTDVETASACPRRATGPGGPPGEPIPSTRIAADHFTRAPSPALRRTPSAPFAPHPRC